MRSLDPIDSENMALNLIAVGKYWFQETYSRHVCIPNGSRDLSNVLHGIPRIF